MTAGPVASNREAKVQAQAVRSARASRRAAKISIIGISLVVVLGFIAASVAFSVLFNVQQLAEMTRRHVGLWRDIENTTTYVLGAREERPVPTGVAAKMQAKVAFLLVDEQRISAEIRVLAKQTHFFRRFLFTTDDEEGVIRAADIDPQTRSQIAHFSKSLPAVVAAGFSAWTSVNDLKLRSGIALNPLFRREKVLVDIKFRVINAMWSMLSVIVALVVSSIGLFWFYLLAPSLKRLQAAVTDGARHARAMNHARRRLQEREQFLRVLLDNTPGMIASIDMNFKFTSANRTYLAAFGLSKQDEILGRRVEDVLGPGMWLRVKGPLDAALRGQAISYETLGLVAAEHRYLQANYVPQIDSHGKPNGVVALVTDVHEQRVARDALRASEANLRATLDSIREAVIATDGSGRIARMNPAAEVLIGTTFADAGSRLLEEVVEFREKGSRRPIEKVMSWKACDASEVASGTLLIARDGREYEVLLTVSPISDESKEILGTVIVMRDMTDENLMRQQMSQHDRLRSIGQLAGGIAHDFNNLLAGMRGAAEILEVKERPRLSDNGVKLVKALITTCDRAADLTERLTRFARQTNSEFSIVSVRQIVEEVIEIVGRTIDRRIVIDVDFEAKNAYLKGNLSSLESALLNLCINGAQAMPDGGTLSILVRNVELSAEDCRKSTFDLSTGNYIEIDVCDTGVGIPEKVMSKIFDPFFTTKSGGEGSGIGLAMVFGVVIDHFGALEVSSELYKGTKLRMLLPCLPYDEPPSEIVAPAVMGTALEASETHGGTVLLVEDEAMLRDVLEAMLETLGKTVLTARDGVEAVEKYKQNRKQIDLVLIDLNMPRMGGKEAIAEMRKIDSSCRAIVMTGFADPVVFEDGLLKDTAVVTKPISRDELSRALIEATGVDHDA